MKKSYFLDNTDEKFTKVFVGNLSFQTTWQNLKDYMRKIGKVIYAEVFTNNYGKSRGCGL